MNISRIIVAGILASSMAFAQEDAWPEDEQATEQSEDSTEQASDSAEPQEEPAAQADDAAKPAEPVAQQAEEPKQSEPVDATSTPVEEPRKVSSINSKMGLGLHVDFNYSFLNGLAQDWNMGDEEEAPAGIGFDGGLRFRIPMVDFLQFTPEVNFHYAELTQEDEAAKRRFKQMDLEIPALIRGIVMDRFYIAAGVQFSLSLNSEVTFEEREIDIGGGLGTMNMEIEEKIEQAGFTFGLAFGAGVFVMERLSIDAGVMLGLTDMYPKCDSKLIDNMDGGKQVTIKAGLGFWFM